MSSLSDITKILLLGTNGHIGRNLEKVLQELPNVEVHSVSGRKELDLRVADDVKRFFDGKFFHYVFLLAAIGGSRLVPETLAVFEENVALVDNVMSCESSFGHVLCFGSGAEYDRTKSVEPEADFSQPPPDGQWYGKAKYVIRRKYQEHPKFIMWRIISCHGPDEIPQRFFSSCLRAIQEGRPVVIERDRKFDFAHVKHICAFAVRLVQGDVEAKRNIDLCYEKKYYLSEVATAIGAQFSVAEKSECHYIGRPDHAFAGHYDWDFPSAATK